MKTLKEFLTTILIGAGYLTIVLAILVAGLWLVWQEPVQYVLVGILVTFIVIGGLWAIGDWVRYEYPHIFKDKNEDDHHVEYVNDDLADWP